VFRFAYLRQCNIKVLAHGGGGTRASVDDVALVLVAVRLQKTAHQCFEMVWLCVVVV
jgi:hypothetical protein